jgi:hypothetical protein
MNRPDWTDVIFAAVAFGTIGFGLGCMICGVSVHGLRVEAVKVGHAEWHVNDEGDRTFKWKGSGVSDERTRSESAD